MKLNHLIFGLSLLILPSTTAVAGNGQAPLIYGRELAPDAAAENIGAPSASVRGGPFAQPGYVDATGLGSAANYAVGTSGATVPLLNGANTWSALQSFSSISSPTLQPGDSVIGASGIYKSTGCISIDAYGGNGNGVADNLAAWNAAVTAAGSGDKCIRFGVGTYFFSAQASISVGDAKGVRIMGAGKTVSHLLWGNTYGLTISSGNQATVHVSGLEFLTNAANPGNALTVYSSDCTGSRKSSTFENLAFSGTNSYLTNYWAYELVLNTLSFVNVIDVDFFGDSGSHPYGIFWQSNNVPSCYAIVLNVSESNFINTLAGIFYGTFAQGLTVTQSNFTSGVYGIYQPASAGNGGQLVASDSQFNTSNDAIQINGNILGVQIYNNSITVASNYNGLTINGPNIGWISVVGNQFITGLTTSSTVTITNASPAVVSWTAHGLTSGTVVYLTTTGTLPTGLNIGTPYYVISTGLTANSFELSATPGGSAINTSSAGSGVHTALANYGARGVNINQNTATYGGGIISGNFFNNLIYGSVFSSSSYNMNLQSNGYGPFLVTKNVNYGTGNTIGGGSQ